MSEVNNLRVIASAIFGCVTAIAIVTVFSILSDVVFHAQDESFNAKMTSVRIATSVEYSSTAFVFALISLAIAVIVSLVARRKLVECKV